MVIWEHFKYYTFRTLAFDVVCVQETCASFPFFLKGKGRRQNNLPLAK